MAEISWPEELPETLQLEGLSASYSDPVIRTEMDAGPKKMRRRYTGATKIITGNITVTIEQQKILEDFYRRVIAYGTRRFNMKHPQSLQVQEFRMIEPIKEVSNGAGLYDITITLEEF